MADDLQQRIRKRAHQIWEDEGRPEGRADVHWEKARILVAIEDDKTSLVPVEPERPEPAEVMENLGEFPTALTDEGDRRQFPSRKALAEAEPQQNARGGLLSAFKRRRK